MQIKLFTIPIGDSGAAVEEMNRFLRGNKILEVQNQLISNENGAYWCFCVRYIEKIFIPSDAPKGKVDYKQVLDEATFKKFSRLRDIRKRVESTLPGRSKRPGNTLVTETTRKLSALPNFHKQKCPVLVLVRPIDFGLDGSGHDFGK